MWYHHIPAPSMAWVHDCYLEYIWISLASEVIVACCFLEMHGQGIVVDFQCAKLLLILAQHMLELLNLLLLLCFLLKLGILYLNCPFKNVVLLLQFCVFGVELGML